MTEDRWLTSAEPRKLLDHVEVRLRAARTKAGRRKLRLFACACFRRLRDLLPDEMFTRSLPLAERFADGLAARQERAAALCEVFGQVPSWEWWHGRAADTLMPVRPQDVAAAALSLPLVGAGAGPYTDERRAQADLV